MKKFLKIFICFILFTSFAFVGCKEEEETPEERWLRLYDYNLSGVVDSWEEPFEDSLTVKNNIPEGYEVKEIATIEDFKTIGLESEEDEGKIIYKLVSNLDFRAEKKEDFPGAVDLKGSYLYGNGKTITCFEPDRIDKEGETINNFALFKNAKGAYDLTVYLGCVSSENRASKNYSVFEDVELIDNVRVKGRLELDVTNSDFEISGLAVGNYKSITNSLVDIEVDLSINKDNPIDDSYSLKFGGITSKNSYGSEIKNCVTEVDLTGVCNSTGLFGGITAINAGFIEECDPLFNYTYSMYSNKKTAFGGICGQLEFTGEIKNCVATNNGTIQENEYEEKLCGDIAVGGIAGVSFGSLFYNESLGLVTVKDVKSINAGGFVGASKDSYILRNISKMDINISNTEKMFVANFVGSAMGGIIESCIAIGDVNVTLDYITNDLKAKNVGLFFFNSDNFINSDIEDDFLTINSINKENLVQPKNAPCLYKNIIRGNTSIISNILNENIIGADEESKEETTSEDELPSAVNYGGYWWWIQIGTDVQPRLFLNSNCNGMTVTINGNDRTSNFTVSQDHSTAWLRNATIDISKNLKDYGLLSSEINSASATSFDDLKFYNPTSQQGSYYSNNDQLVKDSKYCDGDKYFDHKVDTLYELTSISKYYKDSDKKRHLTFIVDDSQMVADTYNGDDFGVYIKNNIFGRTYGEEVKKSETDKTYYLYSQAVKDTIQNENERTEKLISEIFELMDVHSDIEKIIICKIVEIANSKVQIYKDVNNEDKYVNNEDYVNLSYTVANEATQRYYALDVVKDSSMGFYRVTLYF